MEMRLLTTEGERNVFAQRLADARARDGASFRDGGARRRAIWFVWPPLTSTDCSKGNATMRKT